MSLLDFWGDQRHLVKRRKTAGNILRQASSSKSKTVQRCRSDEGSLDVPHAPCEPDIEDDRKEDTQTELESCLPEIKANDVDGYCAAKEQEPWSRVKSSIYVDAFNLALETVLADEAHLFDEAELEVFHQWESLSYAAQYL